MSGLPYFFGPLTDPDWERDSPDARCVVCGEGRTPEGHDPCIANLPGVDFACCGHGDGVRAYASFESGRLVRGRDAYDFFVRVGREPPYCPVDPVLIECAGCGCGIDMGRHQYAALAEGSTWGGRDIAGVWHQQCLADAGP